MAEISVLPVAPSRAGAAHILGLLEEAAAEGRDLGSRVPHIQLQARALGCLGDTLDEDVRMLRRLVDASLLTSPEHTAALAQLDRLVGEVRKVIGMVQAVPRATPPS